MVISEAITISEKLLKQAGIQSFALDTRLLLCEAIKKSKVFLITHSDYVLSADEEETFFDFVKRREKCEPVAYILGRCEFMSLEFEVGKDVLIPRPDTEILVEKVISLVGDKKVHLLDLCTGSGAIAISVAKYCKNVTVDAYDISEEALAVAKINAEKNGVADRVFFYCSDILSDFPDGTYFGVMSNPPYIESEVVKTLEPNVKDFEPLIALDGGEDGLLFYRHIAKCADFESFIIFEAGHTQARKIESMLQNCKKCEILCDLSGIERTVIGYNY